MSTKLDMYGIYAKYLTGLYGACIYIMYFIWGNCKQPGDKVYCTYIWQLSLDK